MTDDGETSRAETSRARAMGLLALIRERTEHTQEPVFVAELAAACRLSRAEAEAAWRYLRDHCLIDTFNIPQTARINARGMDALESETDGNSGHNAGTAGSPGVRGYGRVDSAEALNRAKEVPKELERLHQFLPEVTDTELSAYSISSLPIGTFLQSKGQTFSVLTEGMLANAFKEELDRRRKEADRIREEADSRMKESLADRWLRKLKNNPIVAGAIVLALASGGAAALYGNLNKLKPIVPVLAPHPRWAGTWVGQLYSCNQGGPFEITTEIKDAGSGEFTETSFVNGRQFGPFTFAYEGRTATSPSNKTTYKLNSSQDSITTDSADVCQTAQLRRKDKVSKPGSDAWRR
jgi:hypothetical protein